MKLLQLFNQYRTQFGGEETVVRRIAGLVEKDGGEARLIMKTSRQLDHSIGSKTRAFFSGIYNPFSAREIVRYVKHFRPDVALVHNLNPLFSPSVLVALRLQGIPTLMMVHNHSHTCPRADHFRRGAICELCTGGREYYCFLKNCRSNVFESFAYAVRSASARIFRLYADNVTVVIALNEFARNRLITAGFNRERVMVLPNMADECEHTATPSKGRYVAFSGRITAEKGVSTLMEAARAAPEIPVHLAGDGPTLEHHIKEAPPNAKFLGRLAADGVSEMYRSARFLVIPSRWFEGCPLVISEAMVHGLPVIASRIGGLSEVIDDGVDGLLFEPGDSRNLAEAMTELWSNPELCDQMGRAARHKATTEFSESVYWKNFSNICKIAIARNGSLNVKPTD